MQRLTKYPLLLESIIKHTEGRAGQGGPVPVPAKFLALSQLAILANLELYDLPPCPGTVSLKENECK